jgi:hypothetical protein
VATDIFANPAWNNYSVLLAGTFGGTRPDFTTSGANSTDANEYDGTKGVAPNSLSTVVRGDSVGDDGLIPGDFDRSGDVSLGLDIFPVLPNLGMAGGWNQGDTDASGDVSLGLDIFPVLPNLGMSRTPPAVAAIGAVPEPASALLLLPAVAAGLAVRRRFVKLS